MTENEAIERIIRSACSSGKCYDACLYGEGNCEYDAAIIALKEVQRYREIGTVEECREAVEKQIQKKCAIDSCPDHTHYKCPSCGQIELSIYKHGFPRLGRITKYCENCGQALKMESDSTDQ